MPRSAPTVAAAVAVAVALLCCLASLPSAQVAANVIINADVEAQMALKSGMSDLVLERDERALPRLEFGETVPPNHIRPVEVVGPARQVIFPDTPEFDLLPPLVHADVIFANLMEDTHRMSPRMGRLVSRIAVAVRTLSDSDTFRDTEGNPLNLRLRVRQAYVPPPMQGEEGEEHELVYEGRMVELTLYNRDNGDVVNGPDAIAFLGGIALTNLADWARNFGTYVRVAVIPESCGASLDLAFLMDGSGSLQEEGWRDQLEFVSQITSYFNVHENSTRVALVTFHGPRVSHLSYNISIPDCPPGTLWDFDGQGCSCPIDSECSGPQCMEGYFANYIGACDGVNEENVDETADCNRVDFFPHSCSDACTCDPLGNIYTPSDSYTLHRHLNDFIEADDLEAYIDSLPFPDGATHLSSGLQQVNDQVFQLRNGMRTFQEGVPRVLIVLTDGQSNPGFEPGEYLDRLKEKGIIIYSIGVGNFYRPELEQLASEPHEQFVFEVDNAGHLAGIVDRLSYETCEQSALLEVGRRISVELGRGEFRYFTLSCGESTTDLTRHVIVEVIDRDDGQSAVSVHVSSLNANPSALNTNIEGVSVPHNANDKVAFHDRFVDDTTPYPVHVSVQGGPIAAVNFADVIAYQLLFTEFEPVFSIAEDATVGIVVAEAPELVSPYENDGSTWSFSLEDPTGTFDVDSATGEITLMRAVDREEVETYNVRLWISHVEEEPCLLSFQLITFVIADVNDNKPVFNPVEYTVNLPELFRDRPARRRRSVVGEVIVTVMAGDRDQGPNSDITFSITEGNQLGLFAIDENSGEVSIAREIDFEMLENNVITLIVHGRDGGGAVSNPPATITITVLDRDDIPFFPNKPHPDINIAVDTPTGVISFVPVEDDATENNFRCTLTGAPSAFSTAPSADPLGCNIFLVNTVNANEMYEFTLLIQDNVGTFDTIDLTVTVAAANDFAPTFPQSTYEIEVSVATQLGTTILDLMATDADGDDVSCAFESAPGDYLRLEGCRLVVNSRLPADEFELPTVIVVASDEPSRPRNPRTSDPATISIFLLDTCPEDDAACECVSGTRPTCQADLCVAFPCEYEGDCTLTATDRLCSCAPNFAGDDCEITPCDSDPCMNGGTCTPSPFSNPSYTCDCPVTHSGDNCETATGITTTTAEPTPCDDNPCEMGTYCALSEESGLGYECIDGSTTTEAPMTTTTDTTTMGTSTTADSSTSDASSMGSSNGGSSTTAVSTSTNDMANCPCLNGGVCTDENSAYTCECPRRGDFCRPGRLCEGEFTPCDEVPMPNGDAPATTLSTTTVAVRFIDIMVDDPLPSCDCHSGECIEVRNGFSCYCPRSIQGGVEYCYATNTCEMLLPCDQVTRSMPFLSTAGLFTTTSDPTFTINPPGFQQSTSNNTGAIVGGVVGGILALVVIIALILLLAPGCLAAGAAGRDRKTAPAPIYETADEPSMFDNPMFTSSHTAVQSQVGHNHPSSVSNPFYDAANDRNSSNPQAQYAAINDEYDTPVDAEYGVVANNPHQANGLQVKSGVASFGNVPGPNSNDSFSNPMYGHNGNGNVNDYEVATDSTPQRVVVSNPNYQDPTYAVAQQQQQQQQQLGEDSYFQVESVDDSANGMYDSVRTGTLQKPVANGDSYLYVQNSSA